MQRIVSAARHFGSTKILTDLEIMRARISHQSRQRGILECDLLLSTFTKKYISTLPQKQLQELDELFSHNDWDIYYWITGAREPPQEVAEMLVLPALVEHSRNTERVVLRMPDA